VKLRALNSWLADIAVVLGLFAAGTFLVNPFREASVDDDWSYALMVRHSLASGGYVSHDWAAAQPVFQVAWGSLFSALFGFSFATLRFSTLVLALLCIVSIYVLARESGVSSKGAQLVSLTLVASPIFVLLSNSFMTDVPFTACLVAGVCCVMRALRSNSNVDAASGAFALGAAILTRQVGAVVLPVLAWIFWRGGRSNRIRLGFVLGVSILATLYQVTQAYQQSSRTIEWLLVDQLNYLQNHQFGFEILWRPAVAVVYMGFFALPLMGAVVARGRVPGSASGHSTLVCLVATGVAGVLGVGHWAFGKAFVMPILPFTLETIARWPPAIGALFTVLATLNGAWLVVSLWSKTNIRAAFAQGDRTLLVAGVGLLVLLQWTTFYQHWDRYLLPLAPFALIGFGRAMWLRAPTRTETFAVGVLAAVSLSISAAWLRSDLARREAVWQVSEEAIASGADPRYVASSWEWGNFHGFFDRFLFLRRDLGTEESLHAVQDELVEAWESTFPAKADFVVDESLNPIGIGSSWEIVATRWYRDPWLQFRAVRLLRRLPISLVKCQGGYPIERDSSGWWSWTSSSLRCAYKVSPKQLLVTARFDYHTTDVRHRISLKVGTNEQIFGLTQASGAYESAPFVIGPDVAVLQFEQIDGPLPAQLSPEDVRVASFAIKNLELKPLDLRR
jgi:4-amino-4-deoxy-L-arabinose transferase-like glycosyltransferase